MSMDTLTTSLLDLADKLKGVVEPLTLGGGFGLYLKQRHLEAKEDLRTLIPGELWPPARATEDIDLLLSTEVVVGVHEMRALRQALDDMGFAPSVEFMQFEKQTPRGRVKVDLLTGPIMPEGRKAEARIKPPRVRPRQEVELHAYLTPEAIGVEQGAMMLPVSGRTSAGQSVTVGIRIPGSFTLLLMKLHAFKDRLGDERKQLAQHHALDLYRIVAMLTKEEFEQVGRLIAEFKMEPVLQAARDAAVEHFAKADALGVLRLQAYVRDRLAGRFEPDVNAFIAAMRDLFGPWREP
jgi:hypothetical protein